MSDFELTTPQLKYIAQPLREFATEHGVPVTDEAILFNQRTSPEDIRRHGHFFGDHTDGLEPLNLSKEFAVSEIAETIPLLLGRLALYERGHLAAREGVSFDEITWLRLVNIHADDPRVNDILGIIGAHKTHDDPVMLDHDGHLALDDSGNVTRPPVPYTLHPFAGDSYALRLSSMQVARGFRIPMTLVDFSLPDKEYVPKDKRG